MTREPTEMELRVARALLESEAEWLRICSRGLSTISLQEFQARAAIRAMKKPTAMMISNGRDDAIAHDLRHVDTARLVVDVWQSMSDAASPPEGV